MTTSALPNPLQKFQWSRQPEAEAFLRSLLEDFLERNSFAANLARRMVEDSGTRFYDWVDCISLPTTDENYQRIEALGFQKDPSHEFFYRNSNGIFPAFLLDLCGGGHFGVYLKVDSVVDFLAAHQINASIEQLAFSPYRSVLIHEEDESYLSVVERRGEPAFRYIPREPEKRFAALAYLECFRLRRREFPTDEEGFIHADKLITAAIRDLGADQTCSLFFAAEREFWQRKNRAAQIQKSRQDRLGLGWGNHDHHTYRSSRRYFKPLIAFFEKLGCVCRERFYAGREAGWGAQVMENKNANVVVFADVDLAPDELLADFAHEPLAERDALGTVGLWCGLHGEAFLQAGMHHLECQFDFDALKQQLESQHHIHVMKPFTNYPFLKQAFTEGERWPVAEERLQKLLARKLITDAQAQQFRQAGAIGSHLENLERNEGYKGFNQKGVSEIIAATDPRNQK